MTCKTQINLEVSVHFLADPAYPEACAKKWRSVVGSGHFWVIFADSFPYYPSVVQAWMDFTAEYYTIVSKYVSF